MTHRALHAAERQQPAATVHDSESLAPVISLAHHRRARTAPRTPHGAVCAALPAASPRSRRRTQTEIDWVTVLQVANDGARLALRGLEQREAVRRMIGRIDIDLMAWRLRTTPDAVAHVIQELSRS
ncbi:hypothetical protein [Mycobacteroides abscessus]|uniref:hypothetical protein n=1 Tax=Mycobacteroides abscessus TaxID=36809 RepID=UPI000C25D2B3|nr:hypothetical protein [Mycobacteroides abscessus]MBN7374116.1 hypothetical protein [Mycobacteroides abscessus subsp. abscessus]RIR16467.1 hypothetical protein D2E41_26435 [Mycobacteroides abscessus]